MAEFDLRWVGADELQRVTSRQFVSVEKGGVVRAIAVWFECDFNPDCCDEWKFEVNLSTAPGLPDTHWKQTCIILPTKGRVNISLLLESLSVVRKVLRMWFSAVASSYSRHVISTLGGLVDLLVAPLFFAKSCTDTLTSQP